MLYKYSAYNSKGAVVQGEMQGKNITSVLIALQRDGLKPILIKPKYSLANILKIKLGSKKEITIEDQMFLTKYLYLMLKVGTNLIKAIDILKEDFPKQSVRDFLEEIKINLKKGQPFWEAFAKYPKYFSPTFIAMVKAGEASGKLEETFKTLSESLDKQETLRKRVRSALIYPTLLVVVSFIVIGVIVFFAMPRISKIFLSTGVKPPAFTQAVINTSNFLSTYGLYIFGFFIFLIILFYFLYRESLTARRFILNTFYNVPILNKVLEKMDLQSLCSVFSSLLSSGLPIIRAIEITAETLKSPKMKEALLRIAKQRLSIGQTLSESFRAERDVFPQVLVSLISMSEKAGHLETTLITLADFYTEEVDSIVKSIMSILEPVLLVFIGLIVALVALSTIVPIYQMVTKVAE